MKIFTKIHLCRILKVGMIYLSFCTNKTYPSHKINSVLCSLFIMNKLKILDNYKY